MMTMSNEMVAKSNLMVGMTSRVLYMLGKINPLAREESHAKYGISNKELRASNRAEWNDSNRTLFEGMSKMEKEDITKEVLNWFVREGIIDRWSRLKDNEYSLFDLDDEGYLRFLGKVMIHDNFLPLTPEDLRMVGW